MTGTIPKGAVIYSRITPAAQLKVGDIITFTPPGFGEAVTHRIIAIEEGPDGRPAYRTKGDFNEAADPWNPVTLNEPQQARYVFQVPFLGYALVLLGMRAVRIALIGLPAVLIALSLLWSLWREAGEQVALRLEDDGVPHDASGRAWTRRQIVFYSAYEVTNPGRDLRDPSLSTCDPIPHVVREAIARFSPLQPVLAAPSPRPGRRVVGARGIRAEPVGSDSSLPCPPLDQHLSCRWATQQQRAPAVCPSLVFSKRDGVRRPPRRCPRLHPARPGGGRLTWPPPRTGPDAPATRSSTVRPAGVLTRRGGAIS